jgi:uncharacterized protein YndB with AHSA1/START domain
MPVDRRQAALEQRGERWALVFERVLPWPPQRVWRALTERQELEHWHPTPFSLEGGEPGAAIAFQPPQRAPDMGPGRVLEYDPPHLLAHTWFEDELRWELGAHEQGCRLTLTHLFADRFKAARDGAGWHLCLQALEQSLAGTPHAQHGAERIPEGWSELNDEYQRLFGISPEMATPVPGAG